MSRARARSGGTVTPLAGSMAATDGRIGAGWLVVFLLLCLVGCGLATDLTLIHVWVHTDPSYRSFCALSETVNCDTVAESPYSVFLGVPVSVWGVFGYLLMLGVAVFALLRRFAAPSSARWPDGVLLALAGFSMLASLTMGIISTVAIHSFCILCVATYLVNIALFVIALLYVRRRGGVRPALAAMFAQSGRHPGRSLALVAALGLASAALLLFYPAYWQEVAAHGPGQLPSGTTPEGAWWIGAPEPKLTIVEFSDYQCPHCRRGHKEMRALVQQRPEQVRLIHAHFPLDQACNRTVRRPFHPRACEFARWVVCAGQQGRSWEANDLVFDGGDKGKLTLDQFTRRLKLQRQALDACLADPASLEPVKADIERGLSLGVRGTPTYLMGGKLYPGHVPPAVLAAALGDAPASGASSADAGQGPADPPRDAAAPAANPTPVPAAAQEGAR